MTDRKPLISANWKMNLNHFEAIKLIQELSYLVSIDDVDAVDISIHPPFTDLRTVQTTIESDKIGFFLGAQNCHSETSGAFTGEISVPMLEKLNVAYVIAGHSERRALFGETNEIINAKVKAILGSELSAIVCVGESLEQRENGNHKSTISEQLSGSLAKIGPDHSDSLVVAYEPVWAIGTGRSASAADAQEMCAHIRHDLAKIWEPQAAERVRIQYGGSVKPTNIAELMVQPDIDGALVGGASLSAADFAHIIGYRKHLADVGTISQQ